MVGDGAGVAAGGLGAGTDAGGGGERGGGLFDVEQAASNPAVAMAVASDNFCLRRYDTAVFRNWLRILLLWYLRKHCGSAVLPGFQGHTVPDI